MLFSSIISLINSHEQPRQNFSSQYQYSIKQTIGGLRARTIPCFFRPFLKVSTCQNSTTSEHFQKWPKNQGIILALSPPIISHSNTKFSKWTSQEIYGRQKGSFCYSPLMIALIVNKTKLVGTTTVASKDCMALLRNLWKKKSNKTLEFIQFH